MRAVILVGGEGTRLRPLTCTIPKPMVPVANRPFLEHMLNHLKRHGIDDVVLALCYLPDHISSYFGDGSALGMRLTYIVEEAPLGTAGAVRNVHEREPFGSTFLVFNGDVYTDLDLTAMIESHRERRATASIALTPVDDPTVYGIVETAHDNRVRRFLEKPSWDAVTTNMINAGTYVLEPEVLAHMSPGYCTFERDVFPGLLSAAYPLYGFPSHGYWLDIGTPEKYLQLHHDILMGKVPGNLPGERLIEGVWVEEGCDMRPTARVTGPVLMGRNSFVGDHVRVTGPLVMGEGCSISQNSTLEGAVLWNNVHVGSDVVMRDCVIGSGVSIGNDSWITAGTIIGDNAAVGSGNRLERGVRLWPGKSLEADTITFG